MTDSADFTFCQVGVQSSEDDGLGSSETVANMSKISLDESETKRSPFGGSPYSSNGELASVTKNVVDKDGDRASGMEEKKAAAKKSVVRAKVPFEKGHSQMDWLKLTRTHPDLAGLKGRSNRRLISMDEVRQHKSEDSTWTVLKGCVYNITPYMKFHPGGVDMLMKGAGKDCTALFNKYHAWVNAEFLLEKCLVGVLDDNSS